MAISMLPLPGGAFGGGAAGMGASGLPGSGAPSGGGMNGSTPAPPMNGMGHIKGPVGGKNSTMQDLLSPHSGMRTSITGGDQLNRAMGHYGKGSQNNISPSLKQIRGASGSNQMRRIRGGLGPGRMGQAGTSKDYSMTSPDTE